jgi:hypothetical protein
MSASCSGRFITSESATVPMVSPEGIRAICIYIYICLHLKHEHYLQQFTKLNITGVIMF